MSIFNKFLKRGSEPVGRGRPIPDTLSLGRYVKTSEVIAFKTSEVGGPVTLLCVLWSFGLKISPVVFTCAIPDPILSAFFLVAA